MRALLAAAGRGQQAASISSEQPPMLQGSCRGAMLLLPPTGESARQMAGDQGPAAALPPSDGCGDAGVQRCAAAAEVLQSIRGNAMLQLPLPERRGQAVGGQQWAAATDVCGAVAEMRRGGRCCWRVQLYSSAVVWAGCFYLV